MNEQINILIGCEESQAVCIEFRKLGFNAFSCDIQECSGGHPEWHLQMDVFEAIKLKNWDFIGLHPMCTKIAVSGNRHYAKGKPRHNERNEAIKYTIDLWEFALKNCEHVYLENPIGAMNSNLQMPKPQIIHPYYFGDPLTKATCLWLYNLPKLQYSLKDNLFNNKTATEPEFIIYKSKKNKSGTSKYSVFGKLGKGHGKERSKTFPGIAKAIAMQYGTYLTVLKKPSV